MSLPINTPKTLAPSPPGEPHKLTAVQASEQTRAYQVYKQRQEQERRKLKQIARIQFRMRKWGTNFRAGILTAWEDRKKRRLERDAARILRNQQDFEL